MTDGEDWFGREQYPQGGYGRQYPTQGYGQQPQQYPAPPWQPPPYDPRGPQFDPRQAPPWGPPAPRPRRRSWARRHKVVTSLLGVLALLVVLVVVSVASSPSQPGAPARSAALAACASHHAVTSRQWLEIAKDPDAAKGQCIIVYGEITQFDSATGADGFLAQVGGERAPVSFGYADYPTNVVLAGIASELASFVEGDLFSARVTVDGHLAYDTQAGGSTTAPTLRIDSITRIGHLSS